MKNNLLTPNYVNGGYKRELLAGSFLYDRFFFEDIFIDKSKGNNVVKDYLAEKLLEPCILSDYYQKLNITFNDFSKLNHMTNEEMYGLVVSIRKKYFPVKYYKDIILENKVLLNTFYSRKNQTFNELLLEGAYTNENLIGRLKINRIDLLENHIKNSKKIGFIPGDVLQLASILKLIKNHLQDKINYIFIKEKKIKNEPIFEEIEYLLETHIELKELLKKGTIQLVSYNNNGIGLNLNNVNIEAYEILNSINQCGTLIGMGEETLFSLHESNLNFFIISSIKSVTMQFYTNFVLESTKKLPSIVAFIPAGFTPSKDFFGTERSKITLYHFDKIFFGDYPEEFLKRHRSNLVEGVPSYYANFYSTKFDPNKYSALESKSNSISYGNKLKTSIATNELKNRGIQYIDSYYSFDSYQKKEYPIETKIERNCVLVRGGVIANQNNLTAQTILAEDYSTGILSIREVLNKGDLDKDFYLYNNFLYFFPSNLVRMYNELRLETPYEKLDLKDFYLGYKFEKGKKETFPLYNKGYVGFKKSGKVFFGQKSLSGGHLKIFDFEFSWDEADVNNLDSDLTIFTPNFFTEKDIIFDDFRKFRHLVGKDRFNIVIVDNTIISIRKGEVFLPSVGVVLSVKNNDPFFKRFKLKKLKNGYYDISFIKKIPVELSLEKVGEERGANLILGGGTLLVKDGKNLVENEREALKNFTKEGWFNPLSMQTQETQVQNWVRGPRSVMGKTIDNKFFILTFSGRHNETAGARFDEIVKIIIKEIGPIKDLLNLDGGASVCSAMVLNGDVFELSVPAPCDFTIRGMIRPVNSMILLYMPPIS